MFRIMEIRMTLFNRMIGSVEECESSVSENPARLFIGRSANTRSLGQEVRQTLGSFVRERATCRHI
jgi:hypothetical protein